MINWQLVGDVGAMFKETWCFAATQHRLWVRWPQTYFLKSVFDAYVTGLQEANREAGLEISGRDELQGLQGAVQGRAVKAG